jgi:Zn ribbon nucleic-acid-binding protein
MTTTHYDYSCPNCKTKGNYISVYYADIGIHVFSCVKCGRPWLQDKDVEYISAIQSKTMELRA